MAPLPAAKTEDGVHRSAEIRGRSHDPTQISGTLVRILPWAVLIIGLAVTVSAWRFIAAHEQVQIGWATTLAGEAIKADLVEDMEWQRIGLERLGLLWESAEPAQQLWTSNAELYIRHRPGCLAVEWLGVDGDKRVVVTPGRVSAPLAFGGVPAAAIEAAKETRGPVYSAPAAVGDASAQYAFVYPVYTNDRLRGFIVSFFNAAQSIDENLADVRGLGFSFGVTLPGQPEYVLPGTNREHEQDWGQTTDVPLPGVKWQLRVWPNPDALYRIRTAMPTAVLIGGILLSFLASLTLYFAGAIARSSTRIRLANEDLQREIAVREGAEKELRRTHDELDTRVHERTSELAAANALLEKEVTEHKILEESLRDLTAHLFQVQDDERRRLARELHDGATQNLVALGLNLAAVRKTDGSDPERTCALLSECNRLIEGSVEELRTISYLLHPPLLEELGLAAALRAFAEGFALRSGIGINLQFDPRLGRLDTAVELGIYRIVQEALTNIHRHAHTDSAHIMLGRGSASILLEIADDGKGIPAEILMKKGDSTGVGIAGMRERVRLLGGSFDISSNSQGTRIRIVLPLTANKGVASVAMAVPAAARAGGGGTH